VTARKGAQKEFEFYTQWAYFGRPALIGTAAANVGNPHSTSPAIMNWRIDVYAIHTLTFLAAAVVIQRSSARDQIGTFLGMLMTPHLGTLDPN